MKVAIVVAVICSVAFASVVKRQAADQPAPAAPAAPEAQQARVSPIRPIPPPPPPPPTVRTENTGSLRLPSGAELIIGTIVDGFSCAGRIYGYYADLANNCQIFHVCVPAVDEQGEDASILYSFFCGNQTVFDQANLVCSGVDTATPCAEAETYYAVNENFGKTDRPPVRDQPQQLA